MNEDITDALENSAISRKAAQALHSHMPDRQDILNWRDRLLRFLGDLDEGYTVQDIREALEAYE